MDIMATNDNRSISIMNYCYCTCNRTNLVYFIFLSNAKAKGIIYHNGISWYVQFILKKKQPHATKLKLNNCHFKIWMAFDFKQLTLTSKQQIFEKQSITCDV